MGGKQPVHRKDPMTLSPVAVPVLPAHLLPATDPATAFAQVSSLIEAVPEDQLVVINVDIPMVAALVLARASRLQTLVESASKQVPPFEVARFGRLPTVALALIHAHASYMIAAAPVVDDLAALQESGQTLRARLTEDAMYLVKKGALQASQLDQIKGILGYRNLAVDLLALVQLFRTDAAVGPKSWASEEDLGKAEAVGARILQALTARDQLAAASAKAGLVRQKAYSLLFHEYDDIRSVVSYLRWKQDDADSFAPSLFSARRTSRRDRTAPPAPPVVSPSPSREEDGRGVSPAPAPMPPVPPGHQGGSPFIS